MVNLPEQVENLVIQQTKLKAIELTEIEYHQNYTLHLVLKEQPLLFSHLYDCLRDTLGWACIKNRVGVLSVPEGLGTVQLYRDKLGTMSNSIRLVVLGTDPVGHYDLQYKDYMKGWFVTLD